MGNIIGFIFVFLIIFGLSAALGGIPFFVWIILDEVSGNQDYMYVLSYLILSLIELVIFIGFVFGFELNVREFLKSIKNLFKKNKNDGEKKNLKISKGGLTLEIVEIIIIIACTIFAIFYKYHSYFLNLEYSNVIVRILAVDCIPLCIINSINFYREDFAESIFGAIWGQILTVLMTLIIGLCISSTFVFVTNALGDYNHIGNGFKSLFVYDNNKYDEIRSREGLSSEYEILNKTIGDNLSLLKEEKDINKPSDYVYIKSNVFNGISVYGYTITNNKWEDDYVQYICVADKKDRSHKIYKLNYLNYSLEESSDEEFSNVGKDK